MKRIAILGSTGSIGKSLLKIIRKDKKLFNISLLTAHQNYKELLKQAKFFNVKNVILTDKKIYILKKKYFERNNIKAFNDYSSFEKIIFTKLDYVMSSIVGLEGLLPTLKIIPHTKNIAIANKESIICGWNLIKKKLKNYKTSFIPVDSEHFSIWFAINRSNKNNSIKKIYLTASGGPLLNLPLKKIKKIKINQVLKHPNWTMGKKISVDSSTMMNKVFEIIEAKKIFNINYNQLEILIHPDSYIHAIVEYKNKMISIIAHDTTMDIPIANTLYDDMLRDHINFNSLNIKKLNNLNLSNVDLKRFPLVNILKYLPYNNSLFETVLVSANDELVDLYLKKKIKYKDIISILMKVVKSDEFKLMKKKYPKSAIDIFKLNNYVRLKIKKKYINYD